VEDVWITLIVLFGLMFFGMPVAFAVAAAAILGIIFSGLPVIVVAQRMLAGVDSSSMLAVPLFLLMGEIMSTAGLTKRLVNFMNHLVGRFTGGLGAVNVSVNMVMGGMSGSALSDVAMSGSALIPAMVSSGYSRGYAAAITATSSIMGPIIPPSIPFIVYGSVFSVSIGKLFLAGVIPGVLIGVLLLATNWVYSRIYRIGGQIPSSRAQIWDSFMGALPTLLTPILILGGIFGGFFTPTEAAAVGTLYALVLGIFVHRSLTFRQLVDALAQTASSSAVLFFIIAASSAYGWYLARSDVGALIVDLFSPIKSEPLLVLLFLNMVFLLFGCFMETWAIFFLLVPLVMPLVREIGVDPVQFGLILVINLNIGLVTPPFGMCMFISNRIAQASIGEFTRAMLVFLPALLVVLALATYVPALSLWLPNVLFAN
jgi:tripartite ATP-independent transporter DctM subunit